MNLQSIFDIPEICYKMGIRDAVISPGSRNAALTIAFVRHSEIKCLSIPDERSAGFIALGISLQTKSPTVLICTSGSAGLNYSPAVAEAFFNRVPLLILTADRPAELVNIRDGQTIFQKNLYDKHAKAFFDYPASDSENLEKQHNILLEAITQSRSLPPGPAHINIPFEEPFYPKKDQDYSPSVGLSSLKCITQKSIFEEIPLAIKDFQKILIVAGQNEHDEKFSSVLEILSKNKNIPVVSDLIANLNDENTFIHHHDLFLNNSSNDLKPDLIITTGLSILSKKLKQLLRKSPNAAHWHISPSGDSADTFRKLTKNIQTDPKDFCQAWLDLKVEIKGSQKAFFEHWKKNEKNLEEKLPKIESLSFSDAKAYYTVLDQLPPAVDLHLANSMAVRYVNFFGINQSKKTNIFCNRGTSGIDGSNSTAVGSAIASNKETILLSGDLAFLYDRNAFWHNHLPDNLKIIVFNNGGGGIFRLIKGSSEQPELEDYFETQQKSNASFVAAEFGFGYLPCRNEKELKSVLPSFFKPDNRRILEIFTDKKENQKAFKQLFELLT